MTISFDRLEIINNVKKKVGSITALITKKVRIRDRVWVAAITQAFGNSLLFYYFTSLCAAGMANMTDIDKRQSMMIKQAAGLVQNSSQKDIEIVYTLFPKTTSASIMRAA